MRLFSIIVAVYNVEKYLEECLDSILQQSYEFWECILVNDGSSDKKSGEICDAYAKKDTRFKVFHRENEGSLLARRFGFRQSSGEYVLFMDSDDYVHKDLLRHVNSIIEQSQSDLVIYRFQWVGRGKSVDSEIVFPEGTVLEKDDYSRQRIWKRVVTCNSLNNLWLKVAQRKCVDIEEDYSKFADLKSGTDLMQSIPIIDRADKLYFTEKVFYFYRYNNSGITAQKTKSVDIKAIDDYFKNKEILMSQRKRYIKKNTDSEQIMRLHYKAVFKSSMEILISWLAKESNKQKRKQIIKRIMREPVLLECKEYMINNELTGVHKKLYEYYAKGDIRNTKRILDVLVMYKKVVLFKAWLIERFWE